MTSTPIALAPPPLARPVPSPTYPLSPAAALLQAIPQPAWLIATDGSVAAGNTRWREFAGLPMTNISRWWEAVHPDDRAQASRAWQDALAQRAVLRCQIRLRYRGSGFRWTVVQANACDLTAASFDRSDARTCQDSTTPAGADPYWLATITDIDEQVARTDRLTAQAAQREQMLDVSTDAIMIIDLAGRLVQMNRAGRLALGWRVDDPKFGMKWLDLLPAELRRRGQRALQRARSGFSARFYGQTLVAGGLPAHWDHALSPVADAAGNTSGILCVSRDITAQTEAQQRLRLASEVDALTELLNRRSFRVRLNRAVLRARQSGGRVGVLLADLDRFKSVNDTLGHQAGDYLLRVLARRLKAAVPDTVTVGRLGGDEFAVLIGEAADEDHVCEVARLVQRQLEAPITHSGRVIQSGMSIGGAIFPRDANNASGLLSRADTALSDLKTGGRGGIQMFSAAMTQAATRIASELALARTALRSDAVEPRYQPRVALTDGTVVGLEALLRWRGPGGNLCPPQDVAEGFKDYEVAAGFAQRMHSRILADMAAWRDQGLPLLPVAINAAPVELMRGNFVSKLITNLRAYDIPPTLIEVDVTEHMLLDRGVDAIASTLLELKAHGVRVALDDFGTGHSSLAHLRDYPIDMIKIDRSLVGGMLGDSALLAIIQAVAKLGPAFSLEVIAKGVETARQRETLLTADCRLGQGFLFASTWSATEVSQRLGQTAQPVL